MYVHTVCMYVHTVAVCIILILLCRWIQNTKNRGTEGLLLTVKQIQINFVGTRKLCAFMACETSNGRTHSAFDMVETQEEMIADR